jgi:predicted nucleotidyltransferase
LYAFGSVLNENFNENSDIDFIVDIKNDNPTKYTDSYFNLQFGFEDLFKREIDLLSLNSLKNPYFIKNLERTRQLIYG